MSRFNDYILMDYENYKNSNTDIMNLNLNELECKHILFVSESNKEFIELAKNVNYKWVLFGSHRGFDEKDRIAFELNRIADMASSNSSRAVRIVKTSNGKYFADNTHWTLAFLKRFGEDVKLKDIPFYIVDFCYNVPVIVDINGSVSKIEKDMQNAVNAAGDVEERIENGWRPNNIVYTIKQFKDEINMYENEIAYNIQAQEHDL